jgi:hypothetical protein
VLVITKRLKMVRTVMYGTEHTEWFGNSSCARRRIA